MSPKDRQYYRQRAHDERSRATDARDGLASEIHEELACLYEKLVELDERKPELRLVSSERLSA